MKSWRTPRGRTFCRCARERALVANLGTFSVDIGVGRVRDDHEAVNVTALVDTGATYTTLPASLLDDIGIERKETIRITLGDDRAVEWWKGEARITYDQRNWPCPVIFGQEGVYVLGATTLEIFSLAVDPVNLRLSPTELQGRSF